LALFYSILFQGEECGLLGKRGNAMGQGAAQARRKGNMARPVSMCRRKKGKKEKGKGNRGRKEKVDIRPDGP